jgi:hypothetical protein
LDAKEGNIMNQEIYGKYYASSRDGQRCVQYKKLLAGEVYGLK